MKVLVVNTNLTDKNGVAGVIFNYLQAINKDNLQMDLVSINYPDQLYIDIVERNGGHLFVIERSMGGILQYWFRLMKLISKENYDIVHIHGNSHTVVLELSAAWAAGCNVRIEHSHNTKCEHNVVHRLMKPLFDFLVTHRLACGEAAGKWMFDDKPFTVLNNGIDTKKFCFSQSLRDKIRQQFGISDKCFVLGHVGYFYEVKNHRQIINVFEVLYHRNKNMCLILIGDGILKEEMQCLLKEKRLSDVVILTGNIGNVDEFLNAMDAIIMPSLFEGLPLTLIEEQANGLPCVVSDNITREADKTGNMCFLSLSEPLSVWADCIECLQDGKSRKERSIKAIQQIKKNGYDIEEEAKVLKNIYRGTLC